MSSSSEFPVFAAAYQLAAGEAPVMLDGMEVLFDRTIGFYPVRIEPKKEAAPPPPRRNGQGRNGKHANG